MDASGNTALLLASGQLCQAVMLGRDLGVENTTQVQASNRIVRSGAQFYLLTDTGVECLSTDGTSQWTQSLSGPARRVCWPTAGAAGLLRQYGAGIDPACGGKQRSKQYIIRKTRYVQESVISFLI